MKRSSMLINAALLLSAGLPPAQAPAQARPFTSPPGQPQLLCEINPTTVSENGYQIEIYLTNAGRSVIRGWIVTLSFSEPPRITGSWNSRLDEISQYAVTGSNVSWNSELLPGQTTSFGLQGDHDGSFVLPECAAGQV